MRWLVLLLLLSFAPLRADEPQDPRNLDPLSRDRSNSDYCTPDEVMLGCYEYWDVDSDFTWFFAPDTITSVIQGDKNVARPLVCAYCQDFIFLGESYVLDNRENEKFYYHFRGEKDCWDKKARGSSPPLFIGLLRVPKD